ncbi:MAG TPA: hypothetical protein VJX66_03975 [Amycolatopsis sp.]|nr:hypothetical protein [Amycolatopsis sp.]
MASDPEGSETGAVERAAHAYCPVCNPDPQPGDVVTALCGARHPYWGRRDRPLNVCPVCYALSTRPVLDCGH